jgi:hypothetical protein
MDADAVALLRQQAAKDGTLFPSGDARTDLNGCPTAAALAAAGNATGASRVVFVDGPANCSYTGGVFNSTDRPGILVIANGTLALGGNATYHGIVYVLNPNEPGRTTSSRSAARP